MMTRDTKLTTPEQVKEMETNDVSAQPEAQLNPLDLPGVVDNVLGYLPRKDLLKCRRANSSWMERVTKPLNKTGLKRLTFGSVDIFSRRKTKHIGEMKELIRCLNKSKDMQHFPCKSFSVNTDIIRASKRAVDENTLVNFFETVGPISQNLAINFKADSDTVNTDFTATTEYPDLKTFTLSVRNEQRFYTEPTKIGRRLDGLLQLSTGILQNSKSLEKVDFDCTSDCAKEVAPLFINTLVKASETLKITKLGITAPFQLNDWESLMKLRLKLETLTVKFTNRQKNLAGFQLLLQQQSLTLKSLSLSSGFSIEDLHMPTLPLVQKFEFELKDVCQCETLPLCFPKIALSKCFPALKSLAFITAVEWDPYLFSVVLDLQNEEIPTVESLTLPVSWSEPEKVLGIVKHFPNLRKLGVCANDVLFSAVVLQMPQIEELTLDTSLCHEVDHIMTALMPPGRMKMNSDTTASIQLRTLRLHTADLEKDLEVSEIFFCALLQKMPFLKCLDFGKRLNAPDEFIEKSLMAECRKTCQVTWEIMDY